MPELIIKSKGKNYCCLYDMSDRQLISQFKWSINSGGYAFTIINGEIIMMHRLIMNVLDNHNVEVDHRFHNRLDNRKSQLRICTHSENRRNSRKLKPGASSKFKGLYNDLGRWHVQIVQNAKVKNLGRYFDEITAAKKYDQKAIEIFKDFAFINFQSSKGARQLTFPGYE